MKYKFISDKLNELIEKIFSEYSEDILSVSEKRYFIFEFIANNFSLSNYSQSDDRYIELLETIASGEGSEFSISQIYRLLLEKIGIRSTTFVCSQGSKNQHYIILAENEKKVYSFDDVIGAINNFEMSLNYFSYDYQFAKKDLNQKNINGIPSVLLNDIFGYKSRIDDEKFDQDGRLKIDFNIAPLNLSYDSELTHN